MSDTSEKEKEWTLTVRFPNAENVGCGCFLALAGISLFSASIIQIIEAIKK